ncbi:MAG: hypothetical protein KatS3mg108_1569 [Isosphaeraceae bacterium]|nr:MAG: hypothetical protein KatS3mg108_1569 [Isosphaeraceae bacterium]
MATPERASRLTDCLRRDLVLDAGLGARLLAAGLDPTGDDPCLWSLDHPDAVHALHEADRAAGAVVLTTNTFNANAHWLARFHRQADVPLLNRAAVQLARLAADPETLIVGSIGPTAAGHPHALRSQAEVLLDAGVDALLLETFQPDQALAALAALGPLQGPVLVTLISPPPESKLAGLIDAGPAGLGANCVPIETAGRILASIRARYSGLLVARPGQLPDQPIPDPLRWAKQLRDALPPGPAWVGGCCGIGPTQLSALAATIPQRRPF